MQIAMFNGWYFFWLLLCGGATTGLYFLLRHRSQFTQKTVLFSLLALGLLLHFLKVYIPPYSVDAQIFSYFLIHFILETTHFKDSSGLFRECAWVLV